MAKGKTDMSRQMIQTLVVVLVFSSLIGTIASQLTTAALNLTGTAATIVSATIILFIVVGFMLGIARNMDLI